MKTTNLLAAFGTSTLFLAACNVPLAAATSPGGSDLGYAAIPFAEIGAKATADYHGDALAVTAIADGARLRCGFQKLEGHATVEGLWLTSTANGGGKLHLVASSVSRAVLECRSPLPPPLQADPFQSGSGLPQSTTLARPESPNPVGTRSTASPSSPQDVWDAGGTRPYQLQGADAGELAPTGSVQVADKLVRFLRPGLTEEYSVSVDGVRQDFVIESPPLNSQPSTLNPSAGELRLELALSGARAEATAYGAKLKLDGSGRALAYSRLRATDATGRELPARLEVLSPDRLAVCVDDANATYPVRIDPTFSDANWISMNPGIPGANGVVHAAVVDGSGNLYIGGSFTFVGNVLAKGVATWDGSSWSALGSGMNSVVSALAVSGSDLYAGGYFTTAGGSTANYIAKWNGSSWSPLGSGMNNGVEALAVSGSDLYAGGYFTTAGGNAATNIAK